jgi:hypothetical protein
MKTIPLNALNELFKNKQKYFVNKEQGHIGIGSSSDGEQGEYNETFKFYKHPELPEGVFFRETLQTDSYGDNDSVINYEFVEGKEKTITIFEPIN